MDQISKMGKKGTFTHTHTHIMYCVAFICLYDLQ